MSGRLFSSVVAQLKDPVKSTENVQIGKTLKHSISSSSNTRNRSILYFFIPSRHCPLVRPNIKAAQSMGGASSAQAAFLPVAIAL